MAPASARHGGGGHVRRRRPRPLARPGRGHVRGLGAERPADARRGAKTGFCFFDTTPWICRCRMPGRPALQAGSGAARRRALTNRVGVSVGWGDRYPWDFVFQWIDITGLPGGTYRVRATVDIHDFYRETDEFDNCVWSEVRIPAPGSGNKVKVLRNGRGCGPNAMTPVAAFAEGEAFDPPRACPSDRRPCGLDLQRGRHAAAQPVEAPVRPADRDRDGARHPARWLGQLALHGVGAVRRLLASSKPGRPARTLTPLVPARPIRRA